MEYFWLAIIVLIILRAIGVQSRRYKSPGKVDLPREDLPHMERDYPQIEGDFSYNEKDYPYSVRDPSYMEEDYLYNDEGLPSSGDPAWETDGNGQGLSAQSAAEASGHDSDWAGKAGQKGRLTEEAMVPFAAGGDGENIVATGGGGSAGSTEGGALQQLAGGLNRQEVIKGMVWYQILGPRGGLQANRRRRY
ncbi:MAG: hypothetical protein GX325_10275 [Peptococcaceae bacterium]|nr:hypothetical protein [Peptococcaceae bacterium]